MMARSAPSQQVEATDDQSAPFLTNRAALVSPATSDLGLDLVSWKVLARWRRTRSGELIAPSTDVRASEGQRDGISFSQHTIDEAVEVFDWPRGLFVRSIDIG
jgi:hypothetical protein